MNLYYKGEFKQKITDGEANRISTHKGMHIDFNGELLKKSQIEVFSDKSETQDRKISDYSTEELKSVLGDFEKEYNENATGEVIHNEILGYVPVGTIEHALRLGVITKHDKVYYVKLPEYYNYQKKLNVMSELISRREFAQSKNLDAISKEKEKLFAVK